ncbi:MAG: 5-dehydro-2-deoxygluconokinase [Myxococcales bacterium]|nr:5-dehydro-2-deoxygluconokinase [Myxococcales bacterium]
MAATSLDVICVGRAAVDLYAEQVGVPLEDVSSFAKYLGGSPANVAVGARKLGLSTAMLTRVGADPMGAFVRKALAGYGVDVSHVTDAGGFLTGLVILGIEPPDRFPILFYRERCADIQLHEGDVEPRWVASARATVLSGTHLSQPQSRGALHKATEAASGAGRKVALDIDWRPFLWPDGGRAARGVYLEAASRCDLVVGTEEEAEAAGGVAALREACPGLLVVKRGGRGCSVFPRGAPPLDVPGFKVEVLNVLGAGDAFLSGFLRGWLSGWEPARCARLANAVGAIVVTRHGCAPAMPTFEEVEQFLADRGEAIP